jgi:hypothetical protein
VKLSGIRIICLWANRKQWRMLCMQRNVHSSQGAPAHPSVYKKKRLNFLFGRLATADILPDILDLQVADHASLRSIFSLCIDIHSLESSISPDITDEQLNLPLHQCTNYDPDFIAELFLIATLPQLCPFSFPAAL